MKFFWQNKEKQKQNKEDQNRKLVILTSSNIPKKDSNEYTNKIFKSLSDQLKTYKGTIELYCGFPVTGDKINQGSFLQFLQENHYEEPKYSLDAWPFKDNLGGYGFLVEIIDMMPDVSFVDHRTEEELRFARDALSPLDNENEKYANALCEFLQQKDRDLIRKIGEKLYENGGHQRMLKVWHRVNALGGDAMMLERYYWDGIGEWMG
jgi:hypothetical protein